MTLIIGMLCQDGVVIGADGQATFGAGGIRTIRQEVKKLNKIGDCAAIATSGPIGLGQQFHAELDKFWTGNKLSGKTPHEAMGMIQSAFLPHIEREFAAAKVAVPVLGNVAVESAVSYTMVAMVLKKQPCLIQFNQQGSPELATAKLPFIALGSGQLLADPFLAFLRRIFWPDHSPTVNEGVLATLWSLTQAIRTNPGGVGDPIQIMTLEKDERGEFKIRELTDSDLGEHEQAIADAEKVLANYREFLKPAPSDEPPAPTSSGFLSVIDSQIVKE
jgi:20S proteasome alpha/beta subunit